jgi:hypothetical protein
LHDKNRWQSEDIEIWLLIGTLGDGILRALRVANVDMVIIIGFVSGKILAFFNKEIGKFLNFFS